MPETPIKIDDVEVLSDGTGLGFTCRVAGIVLFVGRAVPLPGTTVQCVGDRGRLVLPRWFAEEHGLPTGDERR